MPAEDATAVDTLVLVVPGGMGRQKNFVLQASPLLLLSPRGRRMIWNWCSARAEELPEALQAISGLMDAVGRAVLATSRCCNSPMPN
ncbi:hypothetical protein [Chelativorans sp. M5D2P16]|uniref:hypothetical protein n=1 Tax=Chelativorans sp. M5D2P16 TaxID=3095678 RepID=UPI002ACA8F91|nr:hypothetical protein [Chelativorans sp. M5D2P16]MDZ5696212.1 hypothetical protein [Chelativorans sp. M5D2P16]